MLPSSVAHAVGRSMDVAHRRIPGIEGQPDAPRPEDEQLGVRYAAAGVHLDLGYSHTDLEVADHEVERDRGRGCCQVDTVGAFITMYGVSGVAVLSLHCLGGTLVAGVEERLAVAHWMVVWAGLPPSRSGCRPRWLCGSCMPGWNGILLGSCSSSG